jgi:uncharacterized protein
MTKYLYLHGFASGPQSKKASFLKERFQTEYNIFLQTPDLNPDDFSGFTLTRAIALAAALIEDSEDEWVVIGSSMGGLIATLLAEKFAQVERLILLAPAFDFLAIWSGTELLQQWQADGSYPIYHYELKRTVPLDYQFILDAQQYHTTSLTRVLPTLIVHGQQDETIPIQNSYTYAQNRPWVELKAMASDHSLTNVLPEIWESIKNTIPALEGGRVYKGETNE